MASLKDEGARLINKFYGENFNIWKFKLEMELDVIDLWSIVDKPKEPLHSNVGSKVKREYERRVKKTMSTIILNLKDN